MSSSDLGTIFGSGGLVISIISMIYAAINHKRIRAKCCGKSMDFEINIDPTEGAEVKPTAQPSTSAKVAPDFSTPAKIVHDFSTPVKVTVTHPPRPKRNSLENRRHFVDDLPQMDSNDDDGFDPYYDKHP